MRKSWAFITFAAFAAGIFCGAALLSRPAALPRQPEEGTTKGRETAQPAPAVEPPEGEILQLGYGDEDWDYWGFQWQDGGFCYALPPGWGVEQQGAWARLPNREDSPDWGVTLFAPEGQMKIQIMGAVRPQALTVPGQQKLFSLSREGEPAGQAVFGAEGGQVALAVSFAQPEGAGCSLAALVQAPAEEWERSQDEVLKILGEIYPAGPVRVSGRP